MSAERIRKTERRDSERTEARAPVDGEALRRELGETRAAPARERASRSHLEGLRERAEAALTGGAAGLALGGEAPWSLRRQFLFIALASALCWAVVLAPLMLVF